MTLWTPIDLAALPDPQVLEHLDFEQLLEQRKAHLISLWPAEEQAGIAARLALESEPLTKLLQEGTYRELLLRQRVNEASLAVMLAKARTHDLDQIAANFNVQRLVTAEATEERPLELEADDALRERTQMAFEGLSTAGPRNAYIFHARSADGRVADATAESPRPAEVVVTVLAREGDGSAPPELLTAVATYLSDEDRRPLGDRLTVQGARIIPYGIRARLHLASAGPEAEPIQASAFDRLQELVNRRRRLGVEISASAIHAALHVEGVRKVSLQGWTDILPSPAEAAYCTAIHLSLEATA